MTEALLLEKYVPTYDHVVAASQVFRAPQEQVFDAVTNLDLFRLPLARLLLEARGLPVRLAAGVARRRGKSTAAEPPTFRVRDLPARGWIPLGERPGRELVYGTVGQPWRGVGASPERPVTAAEFADFAEPGFAKLAECTWVGAYGARASVLVLETRVRMTDEESRRRFRQYWIAAGPFISLMRPAAMRALARQLHPASAAD